MFYKFLQAMYFAV